MQKPAYKEIAREARLKVLEMIFKAQSSHVGSNFSCIDILAVLFEKMDLKNDEFVLSKGWAAASIYHFLAEKGLIPKEDLLRFCQPDEEKYIGLIEPMGVFGARCAGGSMSYGLPFGVGMALAKKLNGESGRVYVLMSDGEVDCGTNWEAVNIAKRFKLNNLFVIVDHNKFQAMGYTKDILNINPVSLFSECAAMRVDGHDVDNLLHAFNLKMPKPAKDLPVVLFAETVKGKGVSFMENNNDWHYRAPNQDEYEQAKKELCQTS